MYSLPGSSESFSIYESFWVGQQERNNTLPETWIEPEGTPQEGFKTATANEIVFYFNCTGLSSAMFVYWKYSVWLNSASGNIFLNKGVGGDEGREKE